MENSDTFNDKHFGDNKRDVGIRMQYTHRKSATEEWLLDLLDGY